MAGFSTALALGLLLGAGGATAASKLKRKPAQAATPPPTETSTTGPTVPTPPSPNGTLNQLAQQVGQRQRKRAAAGGSGVVQLPRGGSSTITPQVEPRTLIGY